MVGLCTFATLAWSDKSSWAGTRTLASGQKAGDVSRVQVLLEVGGELKIAEEGKIKPLKMSVVGKLTYDERLLTVPKESTESRSVRNYDVAEAVIKIENGGIKPKLRSVRQVVGVDVADNHTTLFSPQGPLTRDELDLIDVPGNSLLLDQLLPSNAVSPGDRWEHSESLMAALLALDAVSKTEVTSELKELDDSAARIELTGRVEGAAGGVATTLELKGRYKYSVKDQRVTWFALLIEEKRSIGHVGPGADIVARLQMTVTPGSSSPQLTDQALTDFSLDARPEQAVLQYLAPNGKFTFLHDRRWHVMHDQADKLAMRMVDRGDLVAQCNVAQLPPTAAGKHPGLETFQSDIKQSIGESFGQFIKASESTSASGYTLYRVEATGMVSELPIRWIYYRVADQQGHQVVFAFTLEEDLAAQLAESDQAIIDSVEFHETPVTTAAESTVAPTRR
jgi:hypothetical protein